MPETIRAVLLDAGGTLFRLRGSVGEIYADIAARHGWQLDPQRLEERFQEVFPQMSPLCFPGVPPSALHRLERRWWYKLVERVMGPGQGVDFDSLFNEVFAHFATGSAWELFSETFDTLELLRRRRLRLAIVSNFDARLLQICDDLDLSSRVDAVLASGRSGFAKPDPRIFHMALRRLGAHPSEALHVGDSEREDLQGAHSAGMRAVLLRRHAQPGEQRPETIPDLTHLSEWL